MRLRPWLLTGAAASLLAFQAFAGFHWGPFAALGAAGLLAFALREARGAARAAGWATAAALGAWGAWYLHAIRPGRPVATLSASGAAAGGPARFLVGVFGERFVMEVGRAEQAAAAMDTMAGHKRLIPLGDVVVGDGGFNTGHRWHLKPDSVRMVPATPEIYDGMPSTLDRAPERWAGSVRRYGPWGARILARLPPPAKAAAAPRVPARYRVTVNGESFVLQVSDPAVAAVADELATGRRDPLIPMGDLARGDGGFNAGYRWHLVPRSVRFVELAMELCDAAPSWVESNVDEWVEDIRVYCPWQARVTERLPATSPAKRRPAGR